MDCPLCGKEKEYTASVVGGAMYTICPECIDNLTSEEKENWVLKNMREAKERREKGEGHWSSHEEFKQRLEWYRLTLLNESKN
jgi:ribosome-binding protein aMBF1 (putative translation factor)